MYFDDVSPPESILMSNDLQARSLRNSPDVSPIDAPSPLAIRFPKGRHQNSSIPISTKALNNGSAGTLISNWRGLGVSPPTRDSSITTSTRWDDFSGEPTTSEKGKSAQTSPGAVKIEFEPSLRKSSDIFGNQRSNTEEVGKDRRRLSNQRNDQVFTPKESWKGASGRHTIVNPLLDKPLPPGKSHTFPAGTHESSRKSQAQLPSRESPAPTIIHTVQHNDSQVSIPPGTDGSITPLGAVNTDINKSSGTITPFTSQKSVYYESSGLISPDRSSPLARNPSTEIYHKDLPASPDVTPSERPEAQDLEKIENEFRAKMHHMHLEDQPPSRFSATTYATTAYDSPPVTPETNTESPMLTPPLSILNRKRPVPVAIAPNPKITARKPTPSDMRKSAAADAAGRRNEKSLPQSPPEAQAVTREASLQAKLDDLRRRRHNLKTVIYELTNVVQPSSIAYDMASRQEIKKTVDGLKKELSEVIKEEHDTGLQLHRAWKRQDATCSFENSSLWVKRLAS